MKIENWKLKTESGFTLVELLVVVAIISLLAIAVIVAINPAARLREAKTAAAKRDVKAVAEAIERCITEDLVDNIDHSEADAIAVCDTVSDLGISTLATGQALNSSTTSVCFSSLTGTAGAYVKYTHNSSGVTSYSESAGSACSSGT